MAAPKTKLPPLIDLARLHSERQWNLRQTGPRKVCEIEDALEFVEEAGFCHLLTSSRENFPSLYVAVCGRSEVSLPQHTHHDPEVSLAWMMKDEIAELGVTFYAKRVHRKATFVARSVVPFFASLHHAGTKSRLSALSDDAQRVLRALRRRSSQLTWELKESSGITIRKFFDAAIEELQLAMLVVMSKAVYEPQFAYAWDLSEKRYEAELAEGRRITPRDAVTEIIKTYLASVRFATKKEVLKVVDAEKELVEQALNDLSARGILAIGLTVEELGRDLVIASPELKLRTPEPIESHRDWLRDEAWEKLKRRRK